MIVWTLTSYNKWVIIMGGGEMCSPTQNTMGRRCCICSAAGHDGLAPYRLRSSVPEVGCGLSDIKARFLPAVGRLGSLPH